MNQLHFALVSALMSIACVPQTTSPIKVTHQAVSASQGNGRTVIGGSGVCLPAFRALLPQLTRRDVELMPSVGSSGAFRAVQAGRIHIGCASRPPGPEEQRNIQSLPWLQSRVGWVAQVGSAAHQLNGPALQDALVGQHEKFVPILREQGDSSQSVWQDAYPGFRVALDEATTAAVVATTDDEAHHLLQEHPNRFGIADLGAARLAVPTLTALPELGQATRQLFLISTFPADPIVAELIDEIRELASESSILRGAGYRDVAP